MATKKTYVHQDFSQQEIRNASLEKLAAHPTGPDLYEGRFWQLTTDDHLYHYSGGIIRQIANIDDLNKYGALIGGHDASLGAVPTQGSGVAEVGSPDLSIEAGDSWRITTAGTIPGLASGDAELEVGDLLIALIDNASTAADFMAVQLNLDDALLDEVQNYADFGAFPGTGEAGVVYIANDTNEAYVWDGAAYSALSLPNIKHYGTLGSFPGTGDMDILYIADDSNLVYFWDGSAYIPVSGIFSNFYSIDGTLAGNRTVSGGSNNLTFTGILAFTLSTATYDLVTAGDADESIGGNKTVSVVGIHLETSAGKTTTSTGAGNNILNVTDPDGAWVAPGDTNPDGNITTPLPGMIKYDLTDDHFRFYEGGAWRTFGTEVNIQHAANFAAFPVTGNPDIFYIADDTDLAYFWDGATYQLVGGGSVYTNDGTFQGDRIVDGDGNFWVSDNFSAVTFSNVGAFGADSGAIDFVANSGLMRTTGVTNQIYSTGGDITIGTSENILMTATSGGVILPNNADPDSNVTTPIDGMIAYDSTDHEFRAYVNGVWTSLAPDDQNLQEVMGIGSTALLLPTDVDITRGTASNQGALKIEQDLTTLGVIETGTPTYASGFSASKAAGVVSISMTYSQLPSVGGLTMDESEQVVRDDFNTKGLTYFADYESQFTARSLVTKQYVDSLDLGIYGGSGTIPTTVVATQTDDLVFDQPGTVNHLQVQNTTAGDANFNVVSDTTASGDAVVKIDAQDTDKDAYLQFSNGVGGVGVTIGWDSSAATFKMGTTDLGTGVFYEYSISNSTGRHASSLGVGGTFPGASSRVVIRGIGTSGATETLRLEDSTGTDLFVLTDDGAIEFNTSGKSTAHFRMDGDTVANVFFMDASTDGVGFGTDTPDALVEVSGGQLFIAQTTDTMAANAFTVDWDEGNHTVVDLQGSSTTVAATLSNPKAGAWYSIKVIQGTELDNISWPANVLWEGGTAPTITAIDDAIDLIRFYYDGTNYLGSFIQNLQ